MTTIATNIVINSSVVKSYTRFPSNTKGNVMLNIAFRNGSTHNYDVPKKVANAFDKAKSKGKFFNQKIKNAF